MGQVVILCIYLNLKYNGEVIWNYDIMGMCYNSVIQQR